MTRTLRLRHLMGGLVLALGLGPLGVAAAPAHAAGSDDGSPPVTAPDHVTLRAGSGTEVRVLKNDSDPDGDSLAVCRVDDTGNKHYAVFSEDDGLFVDTSTRFKKKTTFTITYYACDFHYLTPGTLTVTVKPLPKVKDVVVTKVAGKLGRLKVVNPNKMAVEFGFGDFSTQEDGEFALAGHSSKVFTVHRHTVDYIAVIRRYGRKAGRGHVHHVHLPKGDKIPPPVDSGYYGGDDDEGTVVAGRAFGHH